MDGCFIQRYGFSHERLPRGGFILKPIGEPNQ